jgi:hypothetical protein
MSVNSISGYTEIILFAMSRSYLMDIQTGGFLDRSKESHFSGFCMTLILLMFHHVLKDQIIQPHLLHLRPY